MKGLKIIKISKRFKFEVVWGELWVKKLFSETIMDKTFETNFRICGKFAYILKKLTQLRALQQANVSK